MSGRVSAKFALIILFMCALPVLLFYGRERYLHSKRAPDTPDLERYEWLREKSSLLSSIKERILNIEDEMDHIAASANFSPEKLWPKRTLERYEALKKLTDKLKAEYNDSAKKYNEKMKFPNNNPEIMEYKKLPAEFNLFDLVTLK